MNRLFASIDPQVWRRFVQTVKSFARSDAGPRAKLMLATLVGLSFAINGLNVVNSYVGRDFFTSIEQQSMPGFVWYAVLYVGVFAASTVVAVLFRFAEERLGLLWRDWLTRDLVSAYVEHPTFYRLNDYVVENGEITNPDQRITDDVRAFTTTTLSFLLLFLNATFTVLAFSGVMWSISPRLFVVGVVYAALGSVGAVFFGHPLVGLNSQQLDKEAELRSELIHLRENAESVALARNETLHKSRLLHRIDDVIENSRRMVAVNRNLGFFVTGYNYMIQIIPALIVAPMFIRGHAQFGEIAQSAMAFSQLLGAFSLIVTQFQSISSFTAIVGRLGSFAEAIEQAQSVGIQARAVCDEHAGPECAICLPEPSPVHASMAIKIHDDDTGILFDKLTLRSGQDETLLHELTVTIPPGVRVLVIGQNQAAKTALFRATAGMWDVGEGWVLRPGPERMAFLPERPYLPRGSLRELLERPWRPLDEQRVQDVLERLGLQTLLARVRGFDHEHDWSEILSLGEQQLVAFARVVLAAPRFAFLDRPVTVLGVDGVDRLLRTLREHEITYLTICETHGLKHHHDAVLELTTDGTWRWSEFPGRPGQG
ncbi:ATP-binding cassette domain-containing protein [Candidatus Binatia bacterium]|nr:ATP-binding cassette domain-containing protein [Candidatus Binatia bacterium]